MKNLDDSKLVSEIRKSNPEAFEVLFNRYHKKVIGFLCQYTHNLDEACNITQDIFTRLWENRQFLKEDRSIANYLFVSAKNQAINFFKRNILRNLYNDFIISRTDENYDAVGRLLEGQELEAIMEKIISKLPPRRKEVFLLNRSEGLTYKEISLKLEISENTVDKQIRLAIQFLRSEIKKYYR